MKDRITIYLADDHQIVIDGLQLLINNEPDLLIVGTSNNGTKAYEELLDKKPDIALIDWRMPGLNGLQLILNLKNKISTQFIILSMHNDKRYISDAKNNDAFGYLLKNVGKDELLRCIHSVINNKKYFPAEDYVLQEKVRKLTPRELEILKLVINENTTQQIAELLNLSHFTVETHRKNISSKTNTKTVIGLVKYALDNGIEY